MGVHACGGHPTNMWLEKLEGWDRIGEGTYGVVYKCFDPEIG